MKEGHLVRNAFIENVGFCVVHVERKEKKRKEKRKTQLSRQRLISDDAKRSRYD